MQPLPPARSATPFATAVAQAARLLATDPPAALRAAQDLLAVRADDPHAQLIAGQALRLAGRPAEALPRMVALAKAYPDLAPALCELGLAAVALGRWDQAIPALEQAAARLVNSAPAWTALATARRALGREADARRADMGAVAALAHDAELSRIALMLREGATDAARTAITARIARGGEEAAAVRLLGEIAWRQGNVPQAIDHLHRALELAPGFDAAREFLVRLLLQTNRLAEARDHAQALLDSPFRHSGHDLLMATVLVRLGEQDGAAAIYRNLLSDEPAQPRVWQNLGHVLKTAGQQAEAISAYRRAVALQPTLGEAWWSLANLKTVKFSAEDIATMRDALHDVGMRAPAEALPEGQDADDDALHLHFALGKALEDAGDAAGAFAHYDQGNRLRHASMRHDPDLHDQEVRQTAATFTARFLADMGPGGAPAADPIFIVGMPRSGSTLIEQILSSHSQIEGTMELPDLMSIAARLQGRIDAGEFPDLATLLRSLSPARRRELGEEYLERTRIYRRTDKPRFIDKLPNNWQHVGLIRLILPNARVIDSRRHPMACCFSAWKQHFARGQTFSYDLGDVGRYYRGYVALMAAWDRAAPGTVHRVIHEYLVADTRGEIERMLAWLDLPFEPATLEFHRNARAVRTASSEQVRRPINRDGFDQWQAFAPWLDPLRLALGPVLDAWPEVPAEC